MATIATRGQLELLAKLLDAGTQELQSLDRLGAGDIEQLRKRISAEIFDSMAAMFRRISALAPLVPDKLITTIAPAVIPPEVAGRAGGAIGMDHKHRAASVAGGLPATYLADAAPYVDPRVVPFFAPLLPPAIIIPAARELLRRGDYLTASLFVEHATPELTREFERGIDDDEGIVRTAALVPGADSLNAILGAVPAERRVRVAGHCATGSAETVLAALSVLSRVSAAYAGPMAAAIFDADPERVIDVAVTEECARELLDVIHLLDDHRIIRIGSSPVFADATVRRALQQACDTASRRETFDRLTSVTA
ncbi:hypothetical protein [Nocardia cyriacigeorgica]|uniref:DUF2336 domain-containing protein n=1 Tax=Nocardia cyriacigeorgica TaxID=135487 RepID=A0A5R8NXI5_9NOCA|nr:hypothetical protein [Nocardia cyriacigeorgica]TLF80769.1 hypothetical protein FEK34_03445 [Nocardia cyriacigeorgica]